MGEDRENKRLRFEETSQVAQGQAEMQQPVLIDEHLRVFRFVGCYELLRLWIKLLVQQVYYFWRQVPALRRCGGHAMVSGHRQEIILSNLGLERVDDSRQIAVHFARV